MPIDIAQIKHDLIVQGVLDGPQVEVSALAGGVSSDIHLLTDGHRRVVVKQALDTLKVAELWRVDAARNVAEQHFIQYVQSFLPDAVPKLLLCREQQRYFVMEYLDGFRDWKSHLLQGETDPLRAHRAGRIIGAIHVHTWNDHSLRKRFDTTGSFHELRVDPYLLTAASRHPELEQQIRDEAVRLEDTRQCLIHGDFSPKNIMVRDEDMVLLDCEVAWYGEPAFDLAFLFNHLLLKAVVHPDRVSDFAGLVAAAWESYRSCFTAFDQTMERRVSRLLLMLMLARVDGKSPVEYIDDERDKQMIRDFVYRLLTAQIFDLADICYRWGQHLKTSA